MNARVYSGNPGSIRVLEKVGYRQEGCLKDELLGPNGREDHLLYGLNKKYFFKSYEESLGSRHSLRKNPKGDNAKYRRFL